MVAPLGARPQVTQVASSTYPPTTKNLFNSSGVQPVPNFLLVGFSEQLFLLVIEQMHFYFRTISFGSQCDYHKVCLFCLFPFAKILAFHPICSREVASIGWTLSPMHRSSSHSSSPSVSAGTGTGTLAGSHPGSREVGLLLALNFALLLQGPAVLQMRSRVDCRYG